MAKIHFKHPDNPNSIKKNYKPLGKKWRHRFYVSIVLNILLGLYIAYPEQFNNYYIELLSFIKGFISA